MFPSRTTPAARASRGPAAVQPGGDELMHGRPAAARSTVWPIAGQTERLDVHMKPRHFSLRFPLWGGLLCLLLCVLTLTAPAALALSGKIREFALPTAGVPVGITAGPDGNLWFAEEGGQIGRITPAGVVTEFATPTADSLPFGIT